MKHLCLCNGGIREAADSGRQVFDVASSACVGHGARHYTRVLLLTGCDVLKKVYVGADPVTAGWLESILSARGIEVDFRNRYLGGGAGELPLNECWPELWIVDDRDESLASRIIEQALSSDTAEGESWVCGQCEERLEAQFSQCWHCGGERGSRD